MLTISSHNVAWSCTSKYTKYISINKEYSELKPHLPLCVVQGLGGNIMIIQGPLCFAFVNYCDRIPCTYPADHTRLFVQYTISLSSLCKLIWRHWIYEMPVRYILSSVWVRLSIFSPLSIIQYVGLDVFSSPISFVMIERIYMLCLIIIIKSEVWTITHCVGLRHETMVSAVCLSIFLFFWVTSQSDLLWPSITVIFP